MSMSSFPSPTSTNDLPAVVDPFARTTPGPVTVTVIDSATAELEALLLMTRIDPIIEPEAVATAATALSVPVAAVPKVAPLEIVADDFEGSTTFEDDASAATTMLTS